MATPLVIHRRDKVGSTQNEALLLVESSGDLPLLLIAAGQTSGRGRTGRSWLTAPRALACSLVVAPEWSPRHWGTIPLLAGLAARSALNEHSGVTPGLKWPNDLVTERGKVGGILVEASDDLVVVGLGSTCGGRAHRPVSPRRVTTIPAPTWPGRSPRPGLRAFWRAWAAGRTGGDMTTTAPPA